MTYEIGQKVETPFGVGKVLYVPDNDTYKISIQSCAFNIHWLYFYEEELKPYKSAHDKLIEKDFNYEYNECNDELSDKVHTYYNPKRFIKIEVTVTPNGVGWHTHFYDPYNYIANLEILEIIKQLVEEMAE